MERNATRAAAVIASLSCCVGWVAAADVVNRGAELKPATAFATISDKRARSVALFTEAGKVIQSPRCINCHPMERRPTQGDDLHAHAPLMQAGTDGKGVPGLPCKSCHGPSNHTTLVSSVPSVPGNSHWGLAPVSMAWQGKSLSEICEQIKDPKQNGGRSLARIQKHMASDDLVGWAWHPGKGRNPAAGTQSEFGALIREWIATGAHCPER